MGSSTVFSNLECWGNMHKTHSDRRLGTSPHNVRLSHVVLLLTLVLIVFSALQSGNLRCAMLFEQMSDSAYIGIKLLSHDETSSATPPLEPYPRAYVTLISTREYIIGAQILACRLRSFSPWFV